MPTENTAAQPSANPNAAAPGSPRPLPFAGLRVLDVSQGISGPYCAHVLWQQGAEVIKVEPPAGDWGRGMGVLREGGTSSLSIAFNGGKKDLCVDATRPEGRAVLARLADQADVIIENFRPGVAKRLGLDADALRAARPDLVFVSISGYGDEGPYAGAPATDSVVQADAGFMFSNRGAGEPRKIGIYLADMNTGLYAAQAVAAALYRRAMGGGGEHIKLNLMETCAATMVCNFVEHSLDPAAESRPVVPASAPNGTYEAADGSVNLVSLNNDQFARICQALERPQWLEDARFTDAVSRLANRVELNRMVAEIIRARPVAHWLERLKAHDLLHAPVRSYSQCVSHPQAQHLGTFQTVSQPGIGEVTLAGIPVHAMRRPIGASPAIGEHTEEVLRAAGFSEAERVALAGCGAVRQAVP